LKGKAAYTSKVNTSGYPVGGLRGYPTRQGIFSPLELLPLSL
jgi:hypothetical protein